MYFNQERLAHVQGCGSIQNKYNPIKLNVSAITKMFSFTQKNRVGNQNADNSVEIKANIGIN